MKILINIHTYHLNNRHTNHNFINHSFSLEKSLSLSYYYTSFLLCVTVRTASYTGGCFNPDARSILDQGRTEAARNLPNDITLDEYAFATCDHKNCFDLSQTGIIIMSLDCINCHQ